MAVAAATVFSLLLAALAIRGPAEAAGDPILSAGSDDVTLAAPTTTIAITLDQAPNGLSGFDLDISLSDPLVAQITDVQYPQDLGLTSAPSNLPDSQVNLFAADIDELIDAGEINITLATIVLQAKSKGTTSIDISVNTTLGIDDDGGVEIDPIVLQPGTLTVSNSDPDAVDDAYDVDEDNILNIAAPGVLDNDTDADGDALNVSLDTGVSNGTLSLSDDGSFTYTPDANFHGTDSFTYLADDSNGGTDTATVTITINPANDNPVAVDDSATTDEDTSVDVDVLVNDTDVDGDSLNIASVTQGANGTAVNNGTIITYTPDAGFSGTDSFTYTISDGNGGSDTATINVTISSVNNAPDGVDDAYSMDEGNILNIPALGVLDNDTDADGDSLTASLFIDVSNGILSLNADGSFSYTPAPDFNGSDSFTYTISDGNGGSDTATVSITVNKVFPTLPGESQAQDLDNNGAAEDVDGNGQAGFTDVVILFQNLVSDEVQDNQEDFDFNGNGFIDFDDVVDLFLQFGALP